MGADRLTFDTAVYYVNRAHPGAWDKHEVLTGP